MQVNARRVGLWAGVVTAVFLVAIYAVREVPGFALTAVGGPGRGVARYGGLVLRYRPPARSGEPQLQLGLQRHGARLTRDGDTLVLEVPKVTAAAADHLAVLLTHGALEFREVLESRALSELTRDLPGHEELMPGAKIADELWFAEDGGPAHTNSYLVAADRDLLVQAVTYARARGWKQPAHSIVMFERLAARPGDRDRRATWRSHVLADRVALDASAVADAYRSDDPNTGRPIVLVDFDDEGGKRFGELTARIVGHKLAMVVGGEVVSAPFINGPIRGGRAAISMGGSDIEVQERDADALVSALHVEPLPAGGVIEHQAWLAPPSIALQLWLARGLVGLLGGVLIGLLAAATIRIARPVWQPRPAGGTGAVPWRRIAVCALAPVVLLVLRHLTLPSINRVELGPLMRARSELFSVGALGLGPITSAFILVELCALITARGRRGRHLPGPRARLGRAVAITAIVVTAVQGYFAATYLEALTRDGAELVYGGWGPRLLVVLTLIAATMVLIVVAGAISRSGIGNGYAVLILSGWLIDVGSHLVDGPSAGDAIGAIALVVIGVATIAILRWRVGGAGELGLRVPSSGSMPLAVATQLAALGQLASLVGASEAWLRLPSSFGWLVGLTIVQTVVWSYVFARPAPLRALTARTAGAGLAPPSPASWRRATTLSLVALALIAVTGQVAAQTHAGAPLLGAAAAAMLIAAIALDLADELRVRRGGDRVAVWALHQPQYAELVRRALEAAGIECALLSSHLRTLLCFFGPHVPIEVMVAPASADAARAIIAQLFDASPGGDAIQQPLAAS